VRTKRLHLLTYYSTVRTKLSLTHTDLLQYSAHSALTYGTVRTKRSLTHTDVLQYSARSVLTYSTVRTNTHTEPLITVQCPHYAYNTVCIVRPNARYSTMRTLCSLTIILTQYNAHNVLTYNRVRTVGPSARHNIVRTVQLLRPPCPLYFSIICTVRSHCSRYFSTQSNVRPQSGSC
jgi:hypothetical protein